MKALNIFTEFVNNEQQSHLACDFVWGILKTKIFVGIM